MTDTPTATEQDQDEADAARLRAARHETLLVLLTRARRTRLTPDEAQLLYTHVEAEIGENDQARDQLASAQHRAEDATAERDRAYKALADARHIEQGDASAVHLANAATAAWQQRARKAEADRRGWQRTANRCARETEDAERRAEAEWNRAVAASVALDRVRALAARMRAGSPQGAAIYAQRIEDAITGDSTTPTPAEITEGELTRLLYDAFVVGPRWHTATPGTREIYRSRAQYLLERLHITHRTAEAVPEHDDQPRGCTVLTTAPAAEPCRRNDEHDEHIWALYGVGRQCPGYSPHQPTTADQ